MISAAKSFTCFGAALFSCFLPFSAPLFSVKDLLPIPKSPPPPSYSTSCSLESTFSSFTSSFATCKYKSSTHPLLNLEIILLNSSLAKASTKFFRCTDFRNFTILAGNFISSPWSTFISK